MMPQQIANCEALVKAWDDGEIIWSIEMGGLGPGYEQAIQITAMEILRYMLAHPPDWEKIDADPEDAPYGSRAWDVYRDEMDKSLFGEGNPCEELGLSGAQFSAACNIAVVFLRNGYQEGLAKAPDDRRIQVSRSFPN